MFIRMHSKLIQQLYFEEQKLSIRWLFYQSLLFLSNKKNASRIFEYQRYIFFRYGKENRLFIKTLEMKIIIE
jgi:hypothetical protein